MQFNLRVQLPQSEPRNYLQHHCLTSSLVQTCSSLSTLCPDLQSSFSLSGTYQTCRCSRVEHKSRHEVPVSSRLFARVSGQRKKKSVPCEQEMSGLFRAAEEALGLNYNLNSKLPTPPAGQTCAEEANGRGFLLLVFLLLGGLLSERSLSSFCYHGLSISLRKGGNGDPI